MTSSCSAAQAACQERCRADIPFWKLSQRQQCQQQCAATYADCYAQLTSEAEEQSNIAAAATQDNLVKLIVVIVAIIIIIFLIWLWRKMRKKA